MSNGAVPEVPAPKKKGLSPLVWVLIGCGGLIVIGLILFVAGVGFVGSKVKQFAEDAEKNPVAAVGKAYALVTPDVEFVSADEAAKTITLRDKKSGKTVTIAVEDLDKGQVSFETEEGSVSIGRDGVAVEPGDQPADGSAGT